MTPHKARIVSLVLCSALALLTAATCQKALAETTPTVVTGSVSVTNTVSVTGTVSLTGSPTVTTTGTVSLSPSTIASLAAAIDQAIPTPSATLSVAGTVPVSLGQVGSFGSGALDALIVCVALAFGMAIALLLGGVRPWDR